MAPSTTRRVGEAMRTTLRTSSLCSGVAAAALVLLAQGALGQGAPVRVRIVALKATPVAEGADRPELPEELAPYAQTLTAIPIVSRYELLGESSKPVQTLGRPLPTFVLPRDHQADVVVTAGRGERPFDLVMVITRPAPPPRQGERVEVLKHEVSIDDGATYVVRVVDGLGKGEHLLLLVTAGTK